MAGYVASAGRRVRPARLAALAVLCVALAACWPAPGQGPDRRAHNPVESVITPGNVASLAPVWTATTDAGGGGTVGPPVVSAHGVHVSDGTGMYGFDIATGARRWRYPEDPVIWPAIADPFVDGDRVLHSAGMLVGYGGSWVSYAAWIDAATGAFLESVPAGRVTGRRGTRLATYSLGGGPRAGGYLVSLAVVDTADPSAGWSGILHLGPGPPAPFQPATLGARRLYHAGDAMETFDAASITTGVRAYPVTPPAVCAGPSESPGSSIRCPLWFTPTDARPVTSPVVASDESVLYVGTEAGTLLALDASDGRVRWTAALGAAPSANPALADGWLYVPLTDGDLVALPAGGCGAARCRVGWRARVDGAGLQPAVAGGVVFVGTDAGRVVALPAAGCGRRRCRPLWQWDAGAAVTGAPAVSGGRLYVGVSPDRVVAFAPN